MDLSTYLIGATVVTFIVGAVFAFIWSLSSGQWRDLAAQARIPLDDEEGCVVPKTSEPADWTREVSH